MHNNLKKSIEEESYRLINSLLPGMNIRSEPFHFRRMSAIPTPASTSPVTATMSSQYGGLRGAGAAASGVGEGATAPVVGGVGEGAEMRVGGGAASGGGVGGVGVSVSDGTFVATVTSAVGDGCDDGAGAPWTGGDVGEGGDALRLIQGVSSDQTGPAGDPPTRSVPSLGPPGAPDESRIVMPAPSSK